MAIRFGDAQIDRDRRELRRGGKVVHVEPKVFDLLLVLIDNRERVVTKDELLETVWEGRTVSETALSRASRLPAKPSVTPGRAKHSSRRFPRRGFRFVADLLSDTLDQSSPAELDLTQDVQFVRTADGVNIAVATAGNGQTIVKTGNWLTHVEHDWESSIWASLNQELASRFRLVRFDGRGYGLSDWDVENISFEASMRDLETVIDGLSLDRVSLLGISQGAASALAYAARHPQRVAKIVIHGGYVRGRKRRNSAEQERAADMFVALMHGWGDEHSAFMRAFSSMFLPKGTAEQIGWFTDLQRKTASPANALRLRIANDQLEISDVVGAVRAPTLVIHSRYDAVVPIAQGRMIAQLVRGANFVELESDNHLILPEEPVWPRFISEIVGFFGRP